VCIGKGVLGERQTEVLYQKEMKSRCMRATRRVKGICKKTVGACISVANLLRQVRGFPHLQDIPYVQPDIL